MSAATRRSKSKCAMASASTSAQANRVRTARRRDINEHRCALITHNAPTFSRSSCRLNGSKINQGADSRGKNGARNRQTYLSEDQKSGKGGHGSDRRRQKIGILYAPASYNFSKPLPLDSFAEVGRQPVELVSRTKKTGVGSYTSFAGKAKLQSSPRSAWPHLGRGPERMW
jgi:hypothetical protein